MSTYREDEDPNFIFGDGVMVSGKNITWFREWRPGTYPYSLTEPFGIGTSA